MTTRVTAPSLPPPPAAWLRTALTVAALLVAVGSLPYAYAWATVPADRVYTGLAFDVPDHAQYWSWVTESRRGLFISNTMTPEPNPAIFMNPSMWLLARVQSVFGLSFPALFQVWRVTGCVLVACAVMWAFGVLVPDEPRRRGAILVALFGAGLGWLLVVANYLLHLGGTPFPNDVYTVEPNTFFAAAVYPNIATAQALVLLTLAAAWRYHQGGRSVGAVAVLSAIALALSHAYDLLTVYAVLGLSWTWLLLRSRRIPVRLTIVAAAIALGSGPIAVYYRHLTASDPLWQQILAQYVNAGVWTPPHLHLLVLVGVPLALAAAGISRAARLDSGPLVVSWLGAGLVLMYLPFVFQVKMLTGWQFPIAIAASCAWHDLIWPPIARAWTRISSRRVHPMGPALLLLAIVIPTNVYLLLWRVGELRRHDRPFFMHRDEYDALAWLSANAGPDDVVLTPVDLGQFVPNYGRTRTYVAHWAMTAQFFERRDAAQRFFRPTTTEAERQRILTRDCVTLVLRPGGMPPASFDPAGAPERFVAVFDRPHARLFRTHVACSAGAEGPRAP